MENLHPITVHFTIALFSLAVLFEILSLIFKKESFKNAAFWNLSFALPSAIASVLSGLYAESLVPHNEVIHGIIETHETFAIIVLSVIAVLFIWRIAAQGKYFRKLPALFTIVGIIGFGLMSVGAYFGGELVFTHGAGVKPVMENIAKQSPDHSVNETANPTSLEEGD
jgi:uncharacterized membrane protein